MKSIAVIGTAGRDKTIPMTRQLWEWMLEDARSRIPFGVCLVSGGAAWADHVAVVLFLEGHVKALRLHLPAPFNGRFEGPRNSSASVANYYHSKFSSIIGEDTFSHISKAIDMGAEVTYEAPSVGYSGMFSRNKLVARSDGMLAYTFGTGDTPADGGTRYTWDRSRGRRLHVPLPLTLD